MKLRVMLPDAERERYGVGPVVSLDLDALLDLPFDEVVALEAAMVGGPSLGRLRLTELPEYTAEAFRAVGFLALRQNGHDPDWATFKPDPGHTLYVLDPETPEDDADPPAGGDSSPPEVPGES